MRCAKLTDSYEMHKYFNLFLPKIPINREKQSQLCQIQLYKVQYKDVF